MSLLANANREAARLLKLAKSNNSENILKIKNLSEAKEHIARINGHKNWHIYSQSLLHSDSLQNNENRRKSSEEEKIFFTRNILFSFNPCNKPILNINKTTTSDESNLKDIVLGIDSTKNTFTKNIVSYLAKEKSINLKKYPLLITGEFSSGKDEHVLSLAYQYIENNKGLIFVEGGNDLTFFNLYNVAKLNNKENDLYLINFNTLNQEDIGRLSHTFDPINPIIHDKNAFKIIFGNEIYELIHKLCLSIHDNNGLVSIENIESFLILDTLEELSNNSIFENSKEFINNYLNKIGFHTNKEKALNRHIENSYSAYEALLILNSYKHVFSIHPDIDISAIIKNKKNLCILCPRLKSHDEYSKILEVIISSLCNGIEHNKNSANIVLNNIDNHIKNNLSEYFFNDYVHWANYIFSIDKNNSNHLNNYFSQCVKYANTFILMKGHGYDNNKPMMLKIINSLEQFSPFYKKSSLNKLSIGEGYVFTSNLNGHGKLLKSKLIFKDIKITFEYCKLSNKKCINEVTE